MTGGEPQQKPNPRKRRARPKSSARAPDVGSGVSVEDTDSAAATADTAAEDTAAPDAPPPGSEGATAPPKAETAAEKADTEVASLVAAAPAAAGPSAASERPTSQPGEGAHAGSAAPRGQRWRRPVVAVLLVLAWVLTPISVTGVWLRNQIFDENTYVDTVAPLSSDPAVQSAVSNYITFLIFSHVNIQAEVEKILPPALDPLAVPLAAAVQSFTAGKVNDVITSNQFSILWDQVNRTAHKQTINFLLGRSGAVGTNGDQVVIDVRPVLTAVVQKLQASGVSFVSRIPLDQINTNFTVANANGLNQVKGGIRLLQGATVLLPLVTLALYLGAIALARDRRRALFVAAVGAAAGCLVLGVALSLARGAYLDSVTGPHLPQDAAAAIYDTIVRFLRDSNRALFAVALVIAVTAWLMGPSRSAVRLRTTVRRGVDRLSGSGAVPGRSSGRAGVWVSEHRGLLRGAVVAVAALVLLFWDRPTGLVVLLIALVALVAIGVVEVVATAGKRSQAPPAVAP